jgi:hypothetical protein
MKITPLAVLLLITAAAPGATRETIHLAEYARSYDLHWRITCYEVPRGHYYVGWAVKPGATFTYHEDEGAQDSWQTEPLPTPGEAALRLRQLLPEGPNFFVNTRNTFDPPKYDAFPVTDENYAYRNEPCTISK